MGIKLYSDTSYIKYALNAKNANITNTEYIKKIITDKRIVKRIKKNNK